MNFESEKDKAAGVEAVSQRLRKKMAKIEALVESKSYDTQTRELITFSLTQFKLYLGKDLANDIMKLQQSFIERLRKITNKNEVHPLLEEGFITLANLVQARNGSVVSK